MIGKIIADWRGWTEKLGGEKNEKFDPIKEIKTSVSVQKDSWDNFQAEVKAAEGNEIKIKAAIDDTKLQQLKNLDGLYDYAVKQSQNGKDVDLGDVNNLIQTQNYQNIASQAHGFSGVNNAIEEYKNSLKKCDDGTTEATANTQKFIDILSTSNSTLADCMTKANGSSIGMGDYAKSLAAATIKTFALEEATMALNTGVSYGISAIISGIVTAIDNEINSVEYAQERLEEFNNAVSESKTELENQKKWIEENGSRYEELARGIDSYGHNVSLTADEFSEYQSITKDISDMFPDMISGYNDQNDVIVKMKGNVDALTESYKDNVKTKYAETLSKSSETFNDYKTAITDAKKSKQVLNSFLNSDNIIGSSMNGGGFQLQFDGYNYADKFKVIVGDDTYANLMDEINNFSTDSNGKRNFKFNDLSSGLQQKIRAAFTTANATITTETSKVKPILEAFVYGDDGSSSGYGELDENGKQIIRNLISNLDDNFYQKFDSDSDMASYFQSYFIEPLKDGLDGSELPVKINTLFSLDKNDYKSYQAYVEAVLAKINELKGYKDAHGNPIYSDEQIENLKKKSGVSDVDSNGYTSGSSLINQVREKYSKIDGAEEYLHTLNEKELRVLYGLKPNEGKSLENLKQAISEMNQDTDNPKPLSFSKAWESIYSEGTDEEKKTAQELLDLAEAGKLTAEAFENSSIAEQFMRNTGLSAEEAANKVNALVEETKQLSAMRTGITAITAAYDEKKENRETSNVVSPDTLSSMYSTLGVSEWDDESAIQSWEKYKKAAGESSTTLKELKAAQDDLATSYINSNNFLSNLTGTNQDYYKSILSEMGITNAAAIVTNTLRQRQADLAVETYNALDSERKTQDELDKVEEKLKGCTKKEKEYYFAKLLANSKNIDTEAERNQLILLAEKLQIDCDMVDALQGKLLNFDGMTATATAKVAYKTESGTSNDINGYNVNTDSHSGSMVGKTNSFFANGANSTKKTPKAQLLASQELNGLKNSIKADIETPKGNKANGTKNDSQSSKSTKTEIDWIERGITRLTTKISLFNAQKENIFTVKKKNANLNKQITQTTKLINTYRAAITKYTKKANSIDLSDSLKKKIRNGQISGSYKSLIKKYDEKDAEKIQSYQNWYDKSKAAKQSLAEAKADKRALQEQQYQNYVDLYDSRTSRAEAKEAAAVGSANQNKAVETQIRNTELSYDYQIRIASELYKDKAKADTLEYEKQKAIVELKKQQVENIKAEYDNRINLLNSGDASKGTTGVKDLQNAISLLEARGQRVSGSYYRSQNGMQKENLKKQTEERKALAARLSQFKNGSQEWYDIQADIQSLDDSINNIKIEIANNNKAILELRDAIYEEIRERDKAISTEVSNIAGLIHGDNVDNNNNLTEAWYAKMGAAGISLKTSLGGYDSDHSLYSAIQRAVAGGKEHAQTAVDESGNTVYRIKAGNKTYDYNSWDDLAADEQKYAALVMQDIQAEYDAEQQIIDLMKEKYQTQLDFLKDIIDAKKELLQENKELYDYEKSISEKTKSIAEIQKQLNALKGDTSEEGRAKRSQLQTQFDESQEDLQDTEWEHALSVQQNMLDNLYEEYQDLMNDLFYDQNKLLRQGIDSINDNGLKIEKILNKTAESYGYATTTDADKVISALGTSHTAITSVADSLNGETGEVGKAIISINNKIGGEDKSSAGSGSGSGSDDLLADENHKARQDSQIVSVNGTTTTLGESKEKEREGLLRAARSFIGVNASKAKKKRDSYSYVNQKIYDSTNGKVLSVANLKKLAEKTLKVSYNGAGKDGSLAKKLKEIKYTGFRTGGIVRANNVPSNGDYIPIRVNPNETILTQKFTDMLPNTVSIMENFTKAIQIPDYTKITTPNTGNKISYGDFHFDIELPNVTDTDSFVREMQNSPKVRKMFTVAFDDLAKSGRLTNNIQGIK